MFSTQVGGVGQWSTDQPQVYPRGICNLGRKRKEIEKVISQEINAKKAFTYSAVVGWSTQERGPASRGTDGGLPGERDCKQGTGRRTLNLDPSPAVDR